MDLRFGNGVMKLVLASASPKRKEILNGLGFDFITIPSGVEEIVFEKDPILLVKKNAQLKAMEVKQDQKEVVLGVDTVVVANSRIFFKPSSKTEAKKMFEIYDELSQKNEKCEVISGMCLTYREHTITDYDISYFQLRNYQDSIVQQQLFDLVADESKSGGFTVEQEGALLFDNIEGSYYNILGLPIHLLFKMFLQLGLNWNDFKLKP